MSQPAAATRFPRQPTPRALRAQAIQRMQIGLFGLATMLLLVSLANIIMQHARIADAGAAASARAASSSSGGGGGTSGDPLADIGVVPAPDAGAAGHHAPARGGGPR